jgi:hypothetical protein
VLDVQVLVTHADSVTIMEREMGHPPRIIRGPDVCFLFQARDEERLPGLVDRWASYGIAAQVVQIPPTGGYHPATVIPHHNPATKQGATTHRRDTHECTHRPRPRRMRPDRTTPD